MSRAVAISVALYRLLLHVYPRDFRRRHAAAIAGVFAEGCELAPSRAALLRWWIWSLRDLFLSASSEHGERFFARLRHDRQMLSGSPGFGAALAALFTPTFAVTGMALSGDLGRSAGCKFILLGAATAQVLVFWATAAAAQTVLGQHSLGGPILPGFGRCGTSLLNRVTAFRHLASVMIRLQFALTGLLLLISPAAFRPLPAIPAPLPPAPWCLLFFPAISLFLVALFFTLEPLTASRWPYAAGRRP